MPWKWTQYELFPSFIQYTFGSSILQLLTMKLAWQQCSLETSICVANSISLDWMSYWFILMVFGTFDSTETEHVWLKRKPTTRRGSIYIQMLLVPVIHKFSIGPASMRCLYKEVATAAESLTQTHGSLWKLVTEYIMVWQSSNSVRVFDMDAWRVVGNYHRVQYGTESTNGSQMRYTMTLFSGSHLPYHGNRSGSGRKSLSGQ